MSNITTAITEIKGKVSLQEWQQRILDCQSSGMSVKTWLNIPRERYHRSTVGYR